SLHDALPISFFKPSCKSHNSSRRVSSISRCSSFGIIPRLSNNSRIESDKFFASSVKVFLNDSVLLLCSNSVYIKKEYKKYAIHLMGNTCYRAEHLISL